MKVQGHRKLKGTIFFPMKFFGELFLQIIVQFGGINLRITTSENTRDVDTKPLKILVECSGYPETFSLSGAVEIFRRYLLIRTDILQKTVDGCPCMVNPTELSLSLLKNKLIKEFLTKRQDKQRIRKPADFTRWRSESGEEQVRFSDENEHSYSCQQHQ